MIKRRCRGHVSNVRIVVPIVSLLLLDASARAGVPDVREISRILDELYRSKSSHGKIAMTVTTPHYTRTLEMEEWSRGLDDSLVRILSPSKERGTATLKRGNEMWNYLPKIRKTIRVPPSMMMASWMGSDFTNDDLMKETSWEKDYDVELMKSTPEGRIGVVYSPKPDAPVTWRRIEALLDASSRLPVSMAYYDDKDRRARLMTFHDIKALGGRRLPARIVLEPLLEDKRGHKTELIYEEMRFDIALPKDLFTLTNLRQEP
jgi:outer membrane lipoprotein-sorting protein